MQNAKLLLRLLRPQRRRVALLLLVIVGASLTVLLFPALAGLLFKLLGHEQLTLPARLDHIAVARKAVSWGNRLILAPADASPEVQRHVRLTGLAALVASTSLETNSSWLAPVAPKSSSMRRRRRMSRERSGR